MPVIHHAHRPQRLDQRQLALIELGKFAVRLQKNVQLHQLVATFAVQQHPQILYRRAIARVIKIDEQRAITPQNIARMAIAVQTARLPVQMPVRLDRRDQVIRRLQEPLTLRCRQQLATGQRLTRAVRYSSIPIVGRSANKRSPPT